MPHPLTRTSLSTGTGNFTFVEDVSDILQVNDLFECFISLEPDGDEFEFNDSCVYIGGGVFSRAGIISSSNDDDLVDFSEGTKTLSINLVPTEIIRNSTGVSITNGAISTTTVTANTVTASTITTNNANFGTHTPLSAEVVTGYITILDSTGTPRKLAVVS